MTNKKKSNFCFLF